jgi:uncharacterized membrane protein YphA (DoxX/SURF4 family)
MLAGLWTPITGVLVAFNEVWIAVSLYARNREEMGFHMFVAVLAVCIVMLGPGAWSIDARLFGRQRFDIDRRGKKIPRNG